MCVSFFYKLFLLLTELSFFTIDLLPSFVSIHYSNVCTIGLIVRVRTHKSNKTNEPKIYSDRRHTYTHTHIQGRWETTMDIDREQSINNYIGWFVNGYLIPNIKFLILKNVEASFRFGRVLFLVLFFFPSSFHSTGECCVVRTQRVQICKCLVEYICILGTCTACTAHHTENHSFE